MWVYLRVALQSLHENKEVIRVRYIFDPTKPAEYVFDKDLSDKSLSTKLLLTFQDHEPCIDNIEFMMPPVKWFQIILIFFLIGPWKIILIDELSSLFIYQSSKHALLGITWLFRLIVFPLMFFERWGLYLYAWSWTHFLLLKLLFICIYWTVNKRVYQQHWQESAFIEKDFIWLFAD